MAKNKDKATEYEVEVETTAELDGDEDSNSVKQPPNLEKIKVRWWPRYLITAAVLAVFTLLIALMQGAFAEVTQETLDLYGVTELQFRCQQWSNAFSVSGVLTVCVGLLVVVSNGGAFDMLSYGIKSVFRLFKKDPIDRKYGGFYEYTQARRQKKRSFWYLVIVGAVFVLIGGALLLAYFVA